jgi:hypothetical protein
MKNVQTKKDEVIQIITKSEDLANASGKFISKAICKCWTEDFVDEDSGEVVEIDRKEILFDKAKEITPTLIPQLLFHLQSGEVKEIEISNQKRAAYESSYGSRIYLAVAEIGPKLKKNKFLFAAPNIPISIEILKDFIELNFIGGYRIVSIKEFQTSLVLDDKMTEMSKINQEDSLNDEKFYHITAIVTMKDGYETKANVVVKTLDLDKALILLNKKLSETYKEEEFTSKLEEAKLLTVDHIIEDDFVLAYKQ